MAKKITGYIKLQVKAGSATPSPPIGPALGQRGVNIMEFCKAFNAKTAETREGHADPDGDHRVRRPQLHLRDQDAAGVVPDQAGRRPQGGRDDPGQGRVAPARSRAAQIRAIAETKMTDLNANSHRDGDEDDRGQRALDGSRRGGGLRSWPQPRSRRRRPRARSTARSCIRSIRGARHRQGQRHRQVRRDDRGRHRASTSIRATPTRWSAASSRLPKGTGKTVRVGGLRPRRQGRGSD